MPVRAEDPELMDLAASDPERLERTLRQMGWINRLLTGSRRLLRATVLKDLRRRPGRPPFTLLDVGSGGGDIAAWLVRSCPALRVVCLDHDPRVIAYARRRYPALSSVEFRLDSASELDRMERFDYVFANHFLHHLPEDRIAPTVQAMMRRTRRLLVINDLLRSRRSYLIYSLFAAAFLGRSFAFHDGRLSIRKGFRLEELRALLAGIERPERLEVRLERPGRVCVIGRPSRNSS
jgi:2-polyprenyl-3-methyl-5-hydroxy-6-metoxy-1,4-benzoquinol methylase